MSDSRCTCDPNQPCTCVWNGYNEPWPGYDPFTPFSFNKKELDQLIAKTIRLAKTLPHCRAMMEKSETLPSRTDSDYNLYEPDEFVNEGEFQFIKKLIQLRHLLGEMASQITTVGEHKNRIYSAIVHGIEDGRNAAMGESFAEDAKGILTKLAGDAAQNPYWEE